jgi:acetate kinase
MKVLVLNAGSASLKFAVIDADTSHARYTDGRKLLTGVVDGIGADAVFTCYDGSGVELGRRDHAVARSHEDSTRLLLDWIDSGRGSTSGIARTFDLDLLAHRMVHGGSRFTEPVLIDERATKAIEELQDLAPLHGSGSLGAIRAAVSVFGQGKPMIAVFDTAFHRTIPEHAALYPIPLDLSRKHQIRRYGFHGTSHQAMMLRYADLTGVAVEDVNIITLHLEGGCSITAVRGGRSMDTSMGLTPLEGLMMSTRCGDIDSALIGFLARKEGLPVERVEQLLNRESGLLGVSGLSPDTRILAQRIKTSERIRLALEMFCYRIRKYIGAYLAAMGGAAGAIVFGGGIGENTPLVRAMVCDGLEWCGVSFDQERNREMVDREGRITYDNSRLHVYVIPSEEELMIAHEAVRCAQQSAMASGRPL